MMCKFLWLCFLNSRISTAVLRHSQKNHHSVSLILFLQLWKQRILLNHRTSVRVERKHEGTTILLSFWHKSELQWGTEIKKRKKEKRKYSLDMVYICITLKLPKFYPTHHQQCLNQSLVQNSLFDKYLLNEEPKDLTEQKRCNSYFSIK